MSFIGMDKMSLLDYEDKVSLVLFSNHCNFRCPFCHNGSSLLESNEPSIFKSAIEYLKTRKNIIDAVVFTGGEPTLEPDLIDKIKEVKSLGFLIKLDTNGTSPKVLKELLDLKLIDYVAMDIKNSNVKYPMTTGSDINLFDKVYESYKILNSSGVDYELRTTLVDEYFSLEDIKDIGKRFSGAKKIYLQKFVDRETCIKKGLHEVDIKKATQFKCNLEKYINNVYLRGY